MKLRNKFLAFVILLHLALTILAFLLLAYNKFYFFGIQLLVVISATVSYFLYRDFIRPLEVLASGVESIRNRDFSCTIVKTGHEELDRLIDVYNRMIEQLRLERTTRQEQQYFLERLIDAASLGVIILDLDGNISLINAPAEDIIGNGAADIVGRPLREVVSRPLQEISDLSPGKSIIVRINSNHIYRCYKSLFLDRGFHRQFFLIEELTEEIIETQKMAYEKVIRAMSHEVNNSAGAINSILQSIISRDHTETVDDSQAYHDAVRIAIDRNSRLSRFMSNYADVVRVPPPQKSKYDLHKLLESVNALMAKDYAKHNVNLRMELYPESLEIEMDVGQMEQVIINIIKNAMEAIDHDGVIIIKTSAKPKTLKIIDTGRGLCDETSANLFTPFFTTKKDGQGIGLTLIREILMNHGFRFALRANADGDTEFQIVFE